MKSTAFKPCKTCIHRDVAQDGTSLCVYLKRPINIEKDGCTWHISNTKVIPCDLCHNNTEQILIYQTKEDKEIYLCPDCSNKLYTCHTCAYLNVCGFVNDHTMPAYVMQNVQKGFMTMQTKVKNPALVEKHCISCRCSADNNGTCCKESNAGQDCNHWTLLSI